MQSRQDRQVLFLQNALIKVYYQFRVKAVMQVCSCDIKMLQNDCITANLHDDVNLDWYAICYVINYNKDSDSDLVLSTICDDLI